MSFSRTIRWVGRIPPVEELREAALANGHVVLTFEDGVDAAWLNARASELQVSLPELCVFATVMPDGPAISMVRVIDRQTVLRHVDELVFAAKDFRARASDLSERLARQLDIPLLTHRSRFTCAGARDGVLDDDWRFTFHGYECCFTNVHTGQTLDVQLEFDGEFGALDPWFFHAFLETTPALIPLAALFDDAYHDTARALEVLVQVGALDEATSAYTGQSSPVARPR